MGKKKRQTRCLWINDLLPASGSKAERESWQKISPMGNRMDLLIGKPSGRTEREDAG